MKRKMVLPILSGILIASCIMGGCSSNISNTSEISSSTSTKIDLNTLDGNLEITSGGTYEVSGSMEDAYIYVKTKDDVVLVLNNATITNQSGPCIYVEKANSFTMELIGDNVLEDGTSTSNEDITGVVYVDSSLVLEGEGSLTINANYYHAIKGKKDITINGGSYNITSIKDCINCNDNLTINGGTFTLTSSEDECLQSDTSLYINDGTFNIDTINDAIKAEDYVEINGGNINITNALEGIESKNTLTINDGVLNINTSDDCINATNKITINGGTIKAYSSTNDAIDSNGTMEINGGDVYAIATTAAEGAYDCDNNSFVINGGNLFGLGSTHSQPTSGSQNTLIISPDDIDGSITNITIKDTDGDIVYTMDVDDYSNMGYTPDMSFGENVGDENFQPNDDGFAQQDMPSNDGDGFQFNQDEMPDMESQGDFQFNKEAPSMENQGNDGDYNQPNEDIPNMGGNKENFEIEETPDTNSDDGMTNNEANGFGRGKMSFGGMNSSNQIFISSDALKTGETYTIYINDEEVDNVTIEDVVTTLGNVQTMGGGMMNGFGKGQNQDFQQNGKDFKSKNDI
jgi:hypothetical protein